MDEAVDRKWQQQRRCLITRQGRQTPSAGGRQGRIERTGETPQRAVPGAEHGHGGSAGFMGQLRACQQRAHVGGKLCNCLQKFLFNINYIQKEKTTI